MKSIKRKWHPTIFFRNLWLLISIIVIIWFTGSFIEIAAKNINPNPTYSKANIIVFLTNWANENLNTK